MGAQQAWYCGGRGPRGGVRADGRGQGRLGHSLIIIAFAIPRTRRANYNNIFYIILCFYIVRVLPHNNLVRAQTADNRTHACIIYILFTYSYIHTRARAHNRATQESSTASEPPRTGQWTWRTFSQPADDDDVISSLANIIGYTAATLYAARSIKRVVYNLFSFSSHFQHSARARDQRPRRILAIPNTPNIRAHGDVSYATAADV